MNIFWDNLKRLKLEEVGSKTNCCEIPAIYLLVPHFTRARHAGFDTSQDFIDQ